MNFNEYLLHFETILEETPAPYDKADYLSYTRLNWARQQRWLKTGTVHLQLAELVRNLSRGLKWIVITEPWCGDAAHSVPFIHKLSQLNPHVEVEYQLRDSAPFLIERYLTNGGKSIPKLIIRDHQDQDLAVWGPRPEPCAAVYNEMLAKQAGFEDIKTALQKWYNEDRGASLQRELTEIFATLNQA